MRFLLDTNVLLRLRDPTSEEQKACVELLARDRRPACDAVLCTQVLIEYWAVATRPIQSNGLGLTVSQANADIDDLRGLLSVLPEPPFVLNRWQELVNTHQVKGISAHDARLVAWMIESSIQGIISLNPRDFRRYSQIQCTLPTQWVSSNPAD